MGNSTEYKICATKIRTFPFYFIIYLFIRSFFKYFFINSTENNEDG